MSWSIERYLNIRQAYGATFAPDGRRLAFLTNITGLPQVWEVAVETPGIIAWPEQLTFDADRVGEVVYSPAPEDDRLLYVRDAGGSEQHQLFLLDVRTGVLRCLSEGFGSAMHLFGSWSGDGSRICFAANRRDPAYFDLYVQEIDGDARLVWKNDARGYLRHLKFSPDGQNIIAVRTSSSFDNALLEIDLVSGQSHMLLQPKTPVRFTDVHYAPDGRALYLITDLDTDFLHVVRLDLATCALDTLVSPAWNCGALTLSRDGTQLAYAVNVDGADQIFLLDLLTWETQSCPLHGAELASAPGLLTDAALVFSPYGDALAFSYSSANHTADIYLWDLASDAIQPLTQSSHGGLPTSTFCAPELVHYPTFDEEADGETRQIPAWFYTPTGSGEEDVPAVVMVHGGPEGQSRPGFSFLIQYLLQHGYAVFAPNVRGSTGYGKAYSHLDDVEKRMDSVADLAYGARWLRAQPGIDGARLVVYGGSYGGFMVLSALTTYPDLWAAAVDIVGISNLATFLENTSEYRRAHREAEYGRLDRDRSFLERIAPINHVDRISAPLMVIHGRNDPRVPLSEAEQLVAALEARGVPVSFLVFDDEGHGIVRLENKLVTYPAIMDFLRQHVGPR